MSGKLSLLILQLQWYKYESLRPNRNVIFVQKGVITKPILIPLPSHIQFSIDTCWHLRRSSTWCGQYSERSNPQFPLSSATALYITPFISFIFPFYLRWPLRVCPRIHTVKLALGKNLLSWWLYLLAQHHRDICNSRCRIRTFTLICQYVWLVLHAAQ